MIDVKELFVGAWVQVLDCPTPERVLAIYRGITGDCIHLTDLECAAGLIVYATKVEPVAISHTILEGNGFKQSEDRCNEWILDIAERRNDNDVRVFLYENSGVWTFQCMSCGLGYQHELTKCYIKNLHQLQVALKLSGIHYEIGI